MTNVFLKIWYKYSQGHSFVMDFSLSTIIITNLHFTLSANLPQYLDAFALHIKINLLLPKCSLRLASPQLNSFFNKSLKSKDSRCSSIVSTNMLLRLWRQSVKKKPLLFKHEFVDCEYYLLYVSTKTWHSCF